MLYRMTENDLKCVVGGDNNYRCGHLVKNIFDGLRVGIANRYCVINLPKK